MFDNRNTSRFVSLLVALCVLMTGAAGVVAADDAMLLDDSTSIDEDTSAVWVDVIGVDDFDGDDPVDVEVVVTGLNDSDDDLNGTEVDSETLTVDEGETSAFDYDLVDGDREDYDELHVSAETVSGNESLVSAEFGTLERVSGGGGGLGGDLGGVPVWLIGLVVIGGLYFVTREDT